MTQIAGPEYHPKLVRIWITMETEVKDQPKQNEAEDATPCLKHVQSHCYM